MHDLGVCNEKRPKTPDVKTSGETQTHFLLKNAIQVVSLSFVNDNPLTP